MDALTYFEFLFSDNELRRGFEEYKRQTPKVVLSYLKNKIALEYVGQGYCTLIDYLLDERK
ncbi:MAG: hypothetical protein MJ252_21120, partial [archaeon]|nr:hypothetical protein [archaeon]